MVPHLIVKKNEQYLIAKKGKQYLLNKFKRIFSQTGPPLCLVTVERGSRRGGVLPNTHRLPLVPWNSLQE